MTGPLMSAVLALLVLMPTEPLAEPALELERAVALAEAVAADLVVAKEDVVRVDAQAGGFVIEVPARSARIFSVV
jgi:hypothetical protein